MRVMLYKSFRNEMPFIITIDKVLDRISGKTPNIAKINNIRETISRRISEGVDWKTIEREVKSLKDSLPAYRFSGEFSRPEDMGLVKHSGLICLDFDVKPGGKNNLGDNTPEEFKAKVSLLPFVFSAFISPSGLGVKVLVKVPASKEGHRGHFKALATFFSEANGWYGTDPTSVNESRICFESYDPNIYINFDCAEFTKYEAVSHDHEYMPKLSAKLVESTNFGAIEQVCYIIQRAQVGERHNEVLKAGKLLGGLIAGGQVKESDIYIAENAVREKFRGENSNIEIRALHDAIRSGLTQPIFTQNIGTPVVNEISNGVIFLESKFEIMKQQLIDGKPKGRTTGFPTLDPHFTFKEGEVTLKTGVPSSGKTTFMLQLDLIQSLMFGTKWAVFTPENYPADEFYDTAIEQLTGKLTDVDVARKIGRNVIDRDEYEAAAKFVGDHFFFIYPDGAHTIEAIEANVMYLMRHREIHGVIIDPFNQVDHGTGRESRDDLYIGKFLADRQRVARDLNLFYQIIVHPNKVGIFKDPLSGRNRYMVPDFYDINGGSVWSAKIDNFLAGERPDLYTDKTDRNYVFHSRKIKKQKRVGLPGSASFVYDPLRSKYLDENGFNPIDSLWSKIYKPKSVFNTVMPEIIQEGETPW